MPHRGQNQCDPGVIIMGYKGDPVFDSTDPRIPARPDWPKDGSLMVFRKLEQTGGHGMDPDEITSGFYGRAVLDAAANFVWHNWHKTWKPKQPPVKMFADWPFAMKKLIKSEERGWDWKSTCGADVCKEPPIAPQEPVIYQSSMYDTMRYNAKKVAEKEKQDAAEVRHLTAPAIEDTCADTVTACAFGGAAEAGREARGGAAPSTGAGA